MPTLFFTKSIKIWEGSFVFKLLLVLIFLIKACGVRMRPHGSPHQPNNAVFKVAV